MAQLWGALRRWIHANVAVISASSLSPLHGYLPQGSLAAPVTSAIRHVSSGTYCGPGTVLGIENAKISEMCLRPLITHVCLRLELASTQTWSGRSWCLSLKRNCLQWKRLELHPWVGKIPSRRKGQPTPVFLPGESHGERSLAGYRPWGHKELGTTEWLSLHFTSYLWSSEGQTDIWNGWTKVLSNFIPTNCLSGILISG